MEFRAVLRREKTLSRGDGPGAMKRRRTSTGDWWNFVGEYAQHGAWKTKRSHAGRDQSFIVKKGGGGEGPDCPESCLGFYEEGRLNDAARDGPSHSGVLLLVQLQHKAAASPKAKQGHVS